VRCGDARVSSTAKYEAKAERWSERAYADADAYLAHRAHLVVVLGPPLAPADTVLDLACGDGALADFLPEEIRYRGVDVSEAMVAEGRRHGRAVEIGDLNDYEPPEPVAATTCFRAIYYARDRRAFFRRVARYTQQKLVFDLNPRQYRIADVRADLEAEGWTRLEVRPFFSPQTRSLPRPLSALLRGLERSGPLARLLLRVRFTYLCAAAR
jgi:SAM-dependent methyltransferase